MAQHNRLSRILRLLALVLVVLAPLTAQAAPYGATYAPGALSCLTPNQVIKTHPISLTNTGTNTWTIQRPGGYHLSYHWYPAGTTPPGQAPIPANQADPLYSGERTYLPNAVAPNGSVSLNANLKAPPTLGAWDLKWDMVHEAVTWFSWQGVLTKDQKVEVKSSCLNLGQLCSKIDCGTLLGPPKIEAVVPFVSNISPGGSAVIKGSWFGNDEGELYLKGLKKWNGVALSPIKLTIAKEPGKDYWKPTGVIGFIPGNITEVKDQPATLQIKTKAGKWSNEFPVNFAAKKDTKQLPAGDVQVSCSDEADWDSCNSVSHKDSIPFCSAPFVSGGGGTFSGYHWTCVGSSNGTDSFSASLKHDWRFEHAALADLSGSVFQTVTMSGFQSGATSTNVKLKWNNSNVSYVLYKVNVSIIGPKGVPHK